MNTETSVDAPRQTQPTQQKSLEGPSDIAVVGMSCRFPGAKDLAQFWSNLSGGVESISFYSAEELAASGIDPSVLYYPNYVNAGSILEDVEMFDASFFDLNPREAESMDPQQRLFMEVAWQALEDAGCNPESYPGSIGVYAGCAMSTYWQQLLRNPDFIQSVGYLQALIGNDKDYLTTHVSYKLNLKGPSITVQSTCSTSLVAICVACQNLLNNACDTALAGGVCVRVPTKAGYFYEPGGIYSPDGHCRVFDAQAQGVIFGNGVGVVVLKRLADAIDDSDNIRAIIKGSAINNDGSLKASYTAPGLNGQVEVITRAMAAGKVKPETIGYVEAHGTATTVGDPIEVNALTKAFRTSTTRRRFCALGSVKSNFGHLDHAAGVAGFIKTVLALEHKMIPPSLNFNSPNPEINFGKTPFYVNSQLSKWGVGRTRRRASVSAFGIGGTNAHVVLEESQIGTSSRSSGTTHLLPLSAKTRSALDAITQNTIEYLKEHPHVNLADVAYTYQVGRKSMRHRRAVVCHTSEDAIQALETLDPKRVFTRLRSQKKTPIFFMFPGQGAQYVNMGVELYRSQSVYRDQIDLCAGLLKPHLGMDLRRRIYPAPSRARVSAERLKQTAITQSALFVVSYALARLWMHWKVQPEAMIGHSVGEYVAACLAGVFSLEDALMLIAKRGKLMQSMPTGMMLAVSLSEDDLKPRLGEGLCIAAVSEPSMCVIAGPREPIEQFERDLAAEGLSSRRVHTSHAFHSAMMDPILQPFEEVVRQVELKPPKIRFISNLTGKWITDSQATDPVYWRNHLRQPVRLSDGLATLFETPECVLLEAGPGRSLSSSARRHPAKTSEQRVFSSLPHPQEEQHDTDAMLTTLGRLWISGVSVNLPALYSNERRRRIPLPTYPFERQRYWIEPVEKAPGNRNAALKKWNLAEWFYHQSWKRTLFSPPNATQNGAPQKECWLFFETGGYMSSGLARLLERRGDTVIRVSAGDRFRSTGAHSFEIDPVKPEHYKRLVGQLGESDVVPTRIAHLWLATAGPEASSFRTFDSIQDAGFYSLLYIAHSLINNNITTPVQVFVISSEIHLIHGRERLCPAKATILGACKTIPQEYLNIKCCNIDVVLPPARSADDELIEKVANEITSSRCQDKIVALRAGQRWVQIFDEVHLGEADTAPARLRKEGVFLLTGGLGNICLELAEELARTVQARLVLVGRSPFPARGAWDDWLATRGEDDSTSRKIRRLLAIESLGAKVLVASADVTNEMQMRHVIAQTYKNFGALHGIIHGAGTVSPEAFFGVEQAGPHNCALHFDPKIRGLLVLEKILARNKLDFWFILSSLSSVLAGLGFVSYSAANSFLDAFVCERNQNTDVPWISINWDAWDLQNNFSLWAMTPKEGVETFRRVISRPDLRQVAVSISDLQTRIDKWINLDFARSTAEEGKQEAVTLHARPSLDNEYVEPRNETEQTIADIWKNLLGIEGIGIHDNFFSDLGGHSLLATQLMARMREKFQVELPLRRFLGASTIADLALAVVQP